MSLFIGIDLCVLSCVGFKQFYFLMFTCLRVSGGHWSGQLTNQITMNRSNTNSFQNNYLKVSANCQKCKKHESVYPVSNLQNMINVANVSCDAWRHGFH